MKLVKLNSDEHLLLTFFGGEGGRKGRKHGHGPSSTWKAFTDEARSRGN